MVADQNPRQRARQRALRQLAQQHRAEYRQLLEIEYDIEGLNRNDPDTVNYRKAQQKLYKQLQEYARLRALRIDGHTIEQAMGISPKERGDLFRRWRAGEHKLSTKSLVIPLTD